MDAQSCPLLSADSTVETHQRSSNRRAWYTLSVLVAAYVLSFIDRQIIGLLVIPIEHDLMLTDVQVSLIQGFAFALVLAVSGLPLGRLIDLGPRTKIIALGTVFWSLMTMGSGLASSFSGLFLSRMGVGIGEAALTPAAHSIVSDTFPPKHLGLALGIFGTGTFIGMGLAYLLGALVVAAVSHHAAFSVPILGPLRPWQIVFLAAGFPGLLVAAWILTLREPVRREFAQPHAAEASMADVVTYFRANFAAIIYVDLCLAFAAMALYALSGWGPTFLIRSYGWTIAQAGANLGPVVMFAGALGVLVGGHLGDRAAARMASGRIVIMSICATVSVPFAAIGPLNHNPVTALALIAVAIFLTTMIIGIGPSAQQAMMPNRMRGMASALGVLIVNVIGLGIGPTAIAFVTDRFFFDPQALRYSLALLLPAMLCLSALFGALCIKPYRRSLHQPQSAAQSLPIMRASPQIRGK